MAFRGPATDQMGRMKIQTIVRLTCLLLLVVQLASITKGQTPIVLPKTLTSESGKTVIFECGYSGLNNEKILFYMMDSKLNASVSCPGDKTKYIPEESMRAYCTARTVGVIATWELAGITKDDNGTVFLCRVNGQNDTVAYLYVYENDSYYARLIGYVIGGFLAALITIVVAYILLKRSEKAQRCFRSVGGIQDDATK